ncbi:sphingomyelin phosphodiesterase [Streptomyces beihaiensis]|uniref:Sphingomyelin phosphodiesterase n=1 Tax=Streptomyces beihaiensis TaxID=2984495 RepID=A0ABT3TUC4_9ACTN|nr:sphingomyelin phosphodiesterase [Streptomyces beihaiensis]MCX3060636.1 sphingomyelin phosphodiesterase [Streptomyces beihaiensis]
MQQPSPVRGALVALALTAVALGTARPASASVADGPDAPRLDVMTYNTFLMSTTLYPNWGQEYRAGAIASAPVFQGHDVVVVEEAFDNSASDKLADGAAEHGYAYRTPVVGRSRDGWDATGGSYSSLTPEDGGVMLLSKWPILRREQYVYHDACGSDALSNKGFVYAVLDVNGQRVHVVGTHTQSDDSACASGQAARVRSSQFKEMSAFLAAKNIPADEEVLVTGDMNVDSRSPEYASMLTDAGLVGADSRTGHPYSFDTTENSIARYRYPDDPSQDIDYALFRAGHARPSGWDNDVVRTSCAPWTVRSWWKSYTYTDLSDHYPLVAHAG